MWVGAGAGVGVGVGVGVRGLMRQFVFSFSPPTHSFGQLTDDLTLTGWLAGGPPTD